MHLEARQIRNSTHKNAQKAYSIHVLILRIFQYTFLLSISKIIGTEFQCKRNETNSSHAHIIISVLCISTLVTCLFNSIRTATDFIKCIFSRCNE